MQLYLVKKVIDGDTFEVSPDIPRNAVLQTSMQPLETPNMFKKVRLANINAPEIRTLPGKLATTYLKGLIEGKHVTLKPIGISYDQVVADVWIYPHHLFVNAAMVYKRYAKQA
jgi:endonuclease YncB( thermonuclease family)